MKNWIENNDDKTIILSSRVRLARNIKNKPFPNRLNKDEAKEIIKSVEDAFYTSDEIKEEFKTIYLWERNNNENVSFLEKHLISSNLLNSKDKSAFICKNDGTVSIMINEEDHIRMQCIYGGMAIREAYEEINAIDDKLEESLEFPFDERLGYITACPTNLGTGMRASVMLHLPALASNNQIPGIINALTQVGMTIRGLYGEGSKGYGDIYQISNQITLGVSEEDIINNIEAITSQLVNQELELREKMTDQYKTELEDKICRSLGILKTARILSTQEALNLLSNVRMGKEMGIIEDGGIEMNKILVNVQPATLQLSYGKELSPKERDIERARLVRKSLGQV